MIEQAIVALVMVGCVIGLSAIIFLNLSRYDTGPKRNLGKPQKSEAFEDEIIVIDMDS